MRVVGSGERRVGHQRFDVRLSGNRVIAECECGWRSESVPSAGLAGALWDAHRAELTHNQTRSS